MDIIVPALVLAGLGFILGFLINLVGKYFYVEEDTRIEKVVEKLPKYNCGSCGYPGCKELAIALLAKEAKTSLCKPMKKEDELVLQQYLNELLSSN
ncbi:MAG: electron transporter RnfB [Firmicutes bacterium]|nr:electron transporter RnfB [Bacillota bacterium]